MLPCAGQAPPYARHNPIIIHGMDVITTPADGLVLRAATPADADRLAEFNIRIHSDDPDQPEKSLGAWTFDLLVRPHPSFQAGLTTIVEEAATGKIVSSALIIPQTWTYAGIPFGVGRPELIGTDAGYRNRGLVRAQMEVLHRWSRGLDLHMQAITGIPWFYRQFGYEMCLELGGGRMGYLDTLPAAREAAGEPFTFRPATADDVPFFLENYASMSLSDLFACRRTAGEWAYEIGGKSPDNHNRLDIRLIVRPDGEPVGYSAHLPRLSIEMIELYFAGLLPGFSWREVAPSLLQFLLKTGGELAAGEQKKLKGVYLSLGSTHPIFDLFPGALPKIQQPYAWYLRIPDLPGFIRRIAPALEKRLDGSALHGYDGSVRLNFYRSGLRMTFSAGKLTAVDDWLPTPDDGGDVRFPDLTFISLLSGRRTFKELSSFFADCHTRKDEMRVLMDILFPAQASNVWAIE